MHKTVGNCLFNQIDAQSNNLLHPHKTDHRSQTEKWNGNWRICVCSKCHLSKNNNATVHIKPYYYYISLIYYYITDISMYYYHCTCSLYAMQWPLTWMLLMAKHFSVLFFQIETHKHTHSVWRIIRVAILSISPFSALYVQWSSSQVRSRVACPPLLFTHAPNFQNTACAQQDEMMRVCMRLLCGGVRVCVFCSGNCHLHFRWNRYDTNILKCDNWLIITIFRVRILYYYIDISRILMRCVYKLIPYSILLSIFVNWIIALNCAIVVVVIVVLCVCTLNPYSMPVYNNMICLTWYVTIYEHTPESPKKLFRPPHIISDFVHEINAPAVATENYHKSNLVCAFVSLI